MKKIPNELLGEYAVRVMDLPDGARAFVVYDDDDFANIYVSARLSRCAQRAAAAHELDHVIHDDIHSAEGIRSVEARAEGRDRPVRPFPRLMRAADLIPPPKPAPEIPRVPATVPRITPYQRAVIRGALEEFDRFLFSPDPYYGY